MSKVGEKNIPLPIGTEASINGTEVMVRGPVGAMSVKLPPFIVIEKIENELVFKRKNDTKTARAMHGLGRSLVANAVIGTNKPWEKVLKVVGTGYRVKQQGEELVFEVGYSHNVNFKKVDGITMTVEGNDTVKVVGVDKQLVGQVAFKIRSIKKPDAYKGKGIRYDGEVLRLKPGKKAKAA